MMESTDQKIEYYTARFRQLGDHSKMALIAGIALILTSEAFTAFLGISIIAGVFLAQKTSKPVGLDNPKPYFDREKHQDLSEEKLDLLEELATTHNVTINLLEKPSKEDKFIKNPTFSTGWKGKANPQRRVVRLEKSYIEDAELYNVEHLALHEVGHCVLRDVGFRHALKEMHFFSGGDGDAEKWAARHFTGTKEQYYELHAELYYQIKVGEPMKEFLEEERSDWF